MDILKSIEHEQLKNKIPELKIGNLYKDMPILKEAQQAAEALLQKDKQLQLEIHQQLKQQVTALWKDAQLSI